MKAKEFIVVEAKKNIKDAGVKTRNPVAKNLSVTASGAGQHKDRKAAMKKGEVKHKGQSLDEAQTQADIQRRIEYNKKMLAAAKQQGWTSTVKDIEAAIEKLQAQLASAPTERPKETPRAPMPKGYKYEPYREVEMDGDNAKITHYLTLPNGKTVTVPFTPYNEMTGKDVELWVKLGMPQKAPGGNFDSEQLQKIASGVGEGQVSEARSLKSGYEWQTPGYENRVEQLEAEGLTTSDAQAVADAEVLSGEYVNWNFDSMSEMDMSSPEFQRLLKSVGEKAKQGPKKTVYDPRTGKYKVVPVKKQGE